MTLHENEIPVDESVVRGLLRTQRPDLADLAVAHVGGGTDNTMYRVGADYLARFPRTREKVTALVRTSGGTRTSSPPTCWRETDGCTP